LTSRLQGAATPFGRGQGIGDELGAHVIGECPADQAARGEVDDRGEIEELPAVQREIGDVTDVLRVRHLGGEVAADQVGCLRGSWVRDGGEVPATQPQTRQDAETAQQQARQQDASGSRSPA
jgi:hypothetical protein